MENKKIMTWQFYKEGPFVSIQDRVPSSYTSATGQTAYLRIITRCGILTEVILHLVHRLHLDPDLPSWNALPCDTRDAWLTCESVGGAHSFEPWMAMDSVCILNSIQRKNHTNERNKTEKSQTTFSRDVFIRFHGVFIKNRKKTTMF